MKIYDIITPTEQIDEGVLSKALASLMKSGAKKAAPKVVAKAAAGGVVRMSTAIFSALKMLGIGVFIMDYYKQMKAADAKLSSGVWTQDKYDDFRQQQMTILTSQLLASTVLFGALKTVTGFNLFTKILSMSRYTRPVSQLFAGVAGTAQLALIYKLQTNEGRKYVADLIGTGIVDDVLGGGGVALLDRAKEFVGLADKEARLEREKQAAEKRAADEEELNKQDPDNGKTPIKPSDRGMVGTAQPKTTGSSNPNLQRDPNGELVWGLNPALMKK
jgi:hypothetical protein